MPKVVGPVVAVVVQESRRQCWDEDAGAGKADGHCAKDGCDKCALRDVSAATVHGTVGLSSET
jgi:hypothetical protein